MGPDSSIPTGLSSLPFVLCHLRFCSSILIDTDTDDSLGFSHFPRLSIPPFCLVLLGYLDPFDPVARCLLFFCSFTCCIFLVHLCDVFRRVILFFLFSFLIIFLFTQMIMFTKFRFSFFFFDVMPSHHSFVPFFFFSLPVFSVAPLQLFRIDQQKHVPRRQSNKNIFISSARSWRRIIES